MKAGWKKSKLADVLIELRNGTNCQQLKDEVGDRVSRIETISTGYFNTSKVGYALLSEAQKERFRLLNGDILFSHINSPPHVGKVALFDSDIPVYQGINLLLMRPDHTLEPKFLYYLLIKLRDDGYWLKNCKQSVNQASVNQKDIGRVEIFYPTLDEQRRIVAVLDKAFAGIATAAANSKKNFINATKLFESAFFSVFHEGDGWEEVAVNDLVARKILEKPTDGNHGDIHPKKSDFVTSGVPFIMASDLDNGVVDQQNCYFISHEHSRRLRKGFAKANDVLISHKGTIGRVAILQTNHEYVMLTPQVTYYRIIDDKVMNARYLYFALQEPSFQKELRRIAGAGSTRAYIGITAQLELKIRFPKLQRQFDISEKLEKISNKIAVLQNLYHTKQVALSDLKQSLLQKAFAGELT